MRCACWLYYFFKFELVIFLILMFCQTWRKCVTPLFFITILQNGCGKHLKFGVKGNFVLRTSRWKMTSFKLSSFLMHILYVWVSRISLDHHNCNGDFMIISSSIGSCHNDPHGSPIFALTYVRVMGVITTWLLSLCISN
jgi:hypothetical protein